ncbi:MAG TPA: hypothetical protein PLR86_02150 [Planctomycetota bacterium]|nr:hypothetical protein [Planctomycetota bacterium]
MRCSGELICSGELLWEGKSCSGVLICSSLFWGVNLLGGVARERRKNT